jgi:hypothetical protein
MSLRETSMHGLSSIPVLQVRNSAAVLYQEPLFKRQLNWLDRKMMSDRMKKVRRYSGTVTNCSKKRIRKAVNLLLQISPERKLYNPVTNTSHPFTINFVTLTFANDQRQISAKEAYQKCLRPFIQWLVKTKEVRHYVWKAELQSRGQLHYHITMNTFVHYKEIQEKWNYLQRKSGLICVSGKDSSTFEPNSTDIHSVYKINDVEGYLCKYMSKDESNKDGRNFTLKNDGVLLPDLVHGNCMSCFPADSFVDRSIDGKVWDCSASLKDNKYFTIEVSDTVERNMANYEMTHEERVIPTDFSMFIKLRKNWQKRILSVDQFKLYDQFIKEVSSYERKLVVQKKIVNTVASDHLNYINSLLSEDALFDCQKIDYDTFTNQINIEFSSS